ncbi:hypothetical protein HPB48_019733 [Haemaphysalis longicornis]|uniref:Uncharacterized protein n=1 Tax=Haemaphysalis longicornis TaxID=44386 RepID=A0A9J6FXQ0_HAELO|nr:hypothetical protein HPB48_019733 [Haemaphysalis longicornis]
MVSPAWQGVTRDTIRNSFHRAGLCREGAEVARSVQGDSDISTLWEELADTPNALPEKVAFADFLTVDDDVAVTARPLYSE